MIVPSPAEEAFIRSRRVARLATTDSDGQPYAVPICYAYDSLVFYSVIDDKPKRMPPQRLRRVANIQANHQVALIIDDYDEDWSQLAYILVLGEAEVIGQCPEQRQGITLLREKYPQYRRMTLDDRPVIKIIPARIVSWGKLQ